MRSWTASALVRWRRSVCSLYACLSCVYSVVLPCVGECARSVSRARGRGRHACIARTARHGGGGVGYAPARNDLHATEAARRARPPRASSPSSSPRSRPACVREPPPPLPGASLWRASTREGASAWMIPTPPSSTSGRAHRRASAPCAEQKGPRARPPRPSLPRWRLGCRPWLGPGRRPLSASAPGIVDGTSVPHLIEN